MSASRCLALAGVLAACCLFWGAAQCTNESPVVTDDQADNFGQIVYVDVLANDTDPDGERLELTVTGGTCGSVGTVTVESDLVRFQPIPPVSSVCTVTYRATDEHGNFDTGTLTFSFVDPSLIFADGFESGTYGAWSSCVACGS